MRNSHSKKPAESGLYGAIGKEGFYLPLFPDEEHEAQVRRAWGGRDETAEPSTSKAPAQE